MHPIIVKKRMRLSILSALTRLVLVAAIIAQAPAYAQAGAGIAVPQLAASAIPSAGLTTGAAIAQRPSWSELSAAELRMALPGLGLLAPADASASPVIRSMARLLDRAGVEPVSLTSETPAGQAEKIQAKIVTEIQSLLQKAQTYQDDETASLPDQIVALDALRSSLDDARRALPSIASANGLELAQRLDMERSIIAARLQGKKEALVRRMINDAQGWNAPAWHGRTAVFSLPDGNMLAVKFNKPDALPLKIEDEGMREANEAGVATPVALGLVKSSFPDADPWLQRMGKDGDFLPYLIPKNIASGFFSYLGAKLPADFKGDKAALIREAADRSMRDIIRLADHGLAHKTLAPMSHSEVSWAWDYFRWNQIVGGVSYGPSNIHSWKKGLSFANLRMSGMADFEHITVLAESIMGQNLTEWSLLVMLAGVSNGLSVRKTADILWSGYKLHAASRINSASYTLDLKRLRLNLLGAARRFYRFHRLSESLPRWMIERVNHMIGTHSAQMIGRGEPLVMSGSVVRKLILDVIYPYVTALKGQTPRKWDHLNRMYGYQSVTRQDIRVQMFRSLQLLPFWLIALGICSWFPISSWLPTIMPTPPGIMAMLLILTTFIPAVLFLGPRVLQGLCGFAKRAITPLWIRGTAR
jgi:hypothetical protein